MRRLSAGVGTGEYGVLSLLVLLAVALAACYGFARLPCANGDFGWGVEIEFKREGSELGPLGASLECRRVQ
jgi:hypothetical protein